MSKKKQNEEKKEILDEVLEGEEVKTKKIKFYKKVWYSITKFDKYLEMGLEGVGSAIKYLFQITAIFVLIIALIGLYNTGRNLKEFRQNIEDNIPDFKYEEGIVSLTSGEDKVYQLRDSNFGLGKIIIDLNTEDEKVISEYTNNILSDETQTKAGIIILKDKVIQVNSLIGTEKGKETGELTYDEVLQNLFGSSNIELTKQSILDYLDGNGKTYIYIISFLSYFIAYFIIYISSGVIYVLILALIGYLLGIITKIRLRFSVVFNMSVYAFTLSNILNMIYFVLNYFAGITIKYFYISYITIANIYLIVIIYLIKFDFFKKQKEKLREARKEEMEKEDGQEQI